MSQTRALRLMPVGETERYPAASAEELEAYRVLQRAATATGPSEWDRGTSLFPMGRRAAVEAAGRVYAAASFR